MTNLSLQRRGEKMQFSAARPKTLYLGRCQVDTPMALVEKVWALVRQHRQSVKKVLDLGAGDGRFAVEDRFGEYIGYEIDQSRYRDAKLPRHATIIGGCAFGHNVTDADLCIGNPPYVRNQDLPVGWREQAQGVIRDRTGFAVSGLANAWQYFFYLALASTEKSGLVALVIPFEWVSRPSSSSLREFIASKGWSVDVYRLRDETFEDVLTTASITVVDKSNLSGGWNYFRESSTGSFKRMRSLTGSSRQLLPFARRSSGRDSVCAKRGLSPGTQKFLTLTESERARCGLRIGIDVIPCVTSLKNFSSDNQTLTETVFAQQFVAAGRKCWLINTSRNPSLRLQAYLDGVPPEGRNTSTCNNRPIWWKFGLPSAPSLLLSTGFRVQPRVLVNQVGAIAVGGVCGIYGVPVRARKELTAKLASFDFASGVVAHAHGLRKLEINQLNAVLQSLTVE